MTHRNSAAAHPNSHVLHVAGALIGSASALCATSAVATVVGSPNLNHDVLDGETYKLPGVSDVEFRNKAGAGDTWFSVWAITGGQLTSTVAVGTLVGPGGLLPSFIGLSGHMDYSAIVGFSTTEDDGVHYGWAEVSNLVTGTTNVGTVERFGFETAPNTPIAVGDVGVPEPSALALAAAGLMAAVGVRRRRFGRPATA